MFKSCKVASGVYFDEKIILIRYLVPKICAIINQSQTRLMSTITAFGFNMLSNFGCVRDIFNDFGVQNMIFMTFWSLQRLTSQGHMVAYKDPCWTVRQGGPKITIFRLQKGSRDMLVGRDMTRAHRAPRRDFFQKTRAFQYSSNCYRNTFISFN